MKKIKVILLQNIAGLGTSGQVKEVASGYARNFLFPKKIAEIASKEKLKQLEIKEKARKEKEKQAIEKNRKIAERLKNITLEFKASAEKEHLFGSFGPKEISQALKEKNIFVDEKQIIMDKHIKTVGDHEVLVDLGHNIKSKLYIKVKAISKRKKSSKKE